MTSSLPSKFLARLFGNVASATSTAAPAGDSDTENGGAKEKELEEPISTVLENGIGPSTARGSGTNGYVQRNLSSLRPRDKQPHQAPNFSDERGPPSLIQKPNQDILLHERKRQVEVQCLELREKLESQNLQEEEIEERVSALREKLLKNLQTVTQDEKTLKEHQVLQLAAEVEEGEECNETKSSDDQNLETSHSLNCLKVVELLLSESSLDKEKQKAFFNACASGNTATVQRLVKSGADVHVLDEFALIIAARNGHTDVVRLLLEAGANCNVSSDLPLLVSATGGRVEVVKLLLVHGANVHAQNDGPLRHAIIGGHTDVVRELIASGARVGEIINEGGISSAAAEGHTEVVKLLLEEYTSILGRNKPHWADLVGIVRVPVVRDDKALQRELCVCFKGAEHTIAIKEAVVWTTDTADDGKWDIMIRIGGSKADLHFSSVPRLLKKKHKCLSEVKVNVKAAASVAASEAAPDVTFDTMSVDTSVALATVQIIHSVNIHPADSALDIVSALDKQVVVPHDLYHVGDTVIYIEIDSQCPASADWAGPLSTNQYRVDTIKMKGELSQGFVIPLETLPNHRKLILGTDVTNELQITKYVGSTAVNPTAASGPAQITPVDPVTETSLPVLDLSKLSRPSLKKQKQKGKQKEVNGEGSGGGDSSLLHIRLQDHVDQQKTCKDEHSRHLVPIPDGFFKKITVPTHLTDAQQRSLIKLGLERKEALVFGGDAAAQRDEILCYSDGSLRDEDHGGYCLIYPHRPELNQSGPSMPDSVAAEIKGLIKSITDPGVVSGQNNRRLKSDCMDAICDVWEAATKGKRSAKIEEDDFNLLREHMQKPERQSEVFYIHHVKAHKTGKMYSPAHAAADKGAYAAAGVKLSTPYPLPKLSSSQLTSSPPTSYPSTSSPSWAESESPEI
ncbi:RNA-splicing factor [Rhizophlyctis rosea]|nr:RNA-splicing factor [Rhizophlyctis rosea]